MEKRVGFGGGGLDLLVYLMLYFVFRKFIPYPNALPGHRENDHVVKELEAIRNALKSDHSSKGSCRREETLALIGASAAVLCH